MKWQKIPLWAKSIFILLSTFIISEIFLRIFNIHGILSIEALNLLTSSSKHLFLTVSNLTLFIIVIFLPIFFANFFTKNIPDSPYYIKQKGNKQEIQILSLKSHKGEGKGIIVGATLSFFYNAFDFFIIKLTTFPSCSYSCGLENSISSLFSIFYLIAGIMLLKDK